MSSAGTMMQQQEQSQDFSADGMWTTDVNPQTTPFIPLSSVTCGCASAKNNPHGLCLKEIIRYKPETTTQLIRVFCSLHADQTEPNTDARADTPHYAVKITRDPALAATEIRGYYVGSCSEEAVAKALPNGGGRVVHHVSSKQYPSEHNESVFVQVFEWVDHPTFQDFCTKLARDEEELAQATKAATGEEKNQLAMQHLHMLDYTHPQMKRNVMYNLLRVVKAMHDQRLAHRDISPCNVLVDFETQQVTLIDVGNATGRCLSGDVHPKVLYMDFHYRMWYEARQTAEEELKRVGALKSQTEAFAEGLRTAQAHLITQSARPSNVLQTVELTGLAAYTPEVPLVVVAAPVPTQVLKGQEQTLSDLWTAANLALSTRGNCSTDVYGVASLITLLFFGHTFQLEHDWVPKRVDMEQSEEWKGVAAKHMSNVTSYLRTNNTRICTVEFEAGKVVAVNKGHAKGFIDSLTLMLGGATESEVWDGYVRLLKFLHIN